MKLVMKDGSFQLVTSYQVEGNRVRYYSAERAEWEEVPADMVDWDATHKAEAAEKAEEKALVDKVKAEEAAAKAAPLDIDASLEVLPGVFLPPGEGMFILDKNAIFSLSQSEASSKLDKARVVEQVLVPIPIVPSRRKIELKGARASFRITNPAPEFYLRTTDVGEPQVELIRAKTEHNKRLIGNVDTLFVEQSEKSKTILLQQWQVAKGVYRFTLGEPLKPGEYALAEFTNNEGMNLFVWDFGVDPSNDQPAKEPK